MSGDSTLNLALAIILLVLNRLWGNANTKKNAADVKIATSSASQVERLETRVMGLQRDMAVVNEKLSKVLPPDDRGPS